MSAVVRFRRRDLESAECFETLTNTWQSLPAMLHHRFEGRAEVIKNHVYIVGGDEHRAALERLPRTGNWQGLPRLTHARRCFATAVLADKLYVCGGFGQASVERFDPEVGVWELLQPMFEVRPCATVAVMQGQLYMCGCCTRRNRVFGGALRRHARHMGAAPSHDACKVRCQRCGD